MCFYLDYFVCGFFLKNELQNAAKIMKKISDFFETEEIFLIDSQIKFGREPLRIAHVTL